MASMQNHYLHGLWKFPRLKVANLGRIDQIRAVPFLRCLTFSYSPGTMESEGVELFVEKYLPIIRENNQHVEYFVRPSFAHYSDAWVTARYEFHRLRKRRVNGQTTAQVAAAVEEFCIGGSFMLKKKGRFGVRTFIPRGQVLLSGETKGHDVFKVFSKRTRDRPSEPPMES